MFNKEKLLNYLKDDSLEIHICNLPESEFNWLVSNFEKYHPIDSYREAKSINLFYEDEEVWCTTYGSHYDKCNYNILKEFKRSKFKNKLK